jgi:hypothetical protein
MQVKSKPWRQRQAGGGRKKKNRFFSVRRSRPAAVAMVYF